MRHARRWMGGLLAVMGGVAVVAATAEPPVVIQDDSALLQELPAAAIATLMRACDHSRIDSVEKQQEGDTRMFLASWTQDERKREAIITEDGELLEINESIASGEVPAAVLKAARDQFGGEDRLSFQRKTIVVYVARARVHGHEHEAIISPTGEVVDDGGHEQEEAPAAEAVVATQPATASTAPAAR